MLSIRRSGRANRPPQAPRIAGLCTALLLGAAPLSVAITQSAPGIGAGVTSRGGRVCRPSCGTRKCGDDGCGGSCGTCKTGRACMAGRCVKSSPKSLCQRLQGKWSGLNQTSPTTHWKGKVWISGSSCRARFVISYRQNRVRRRIVQDFQISIRKGKLLWRGTRIVSTSPRGTGYSLDNLWGRLDRGMKRFTGLNRSAGGTTTRIRLTKK